MAEYTGKNLYLLWSGTAINSDYRSFSPSETIGTVDASAGSDAAVTKLTTLKDGSASLDMVAPAGGTALWAGFEPGTEGTLEWGAEGTATGKPRNYVNAIVTGRDDSHTYNDIVTWSISWEYSGEMTGTSY